MALHKDDPRFTDRRTAGRMLAAVLSDEQWDAPVVLGLARGGVPVAFEAARALRAPLGVLAVRGEQDVQVEPDEVALDDRDVIVCDDGLATDVTARAALRHVRQQGPRSVAFAVPVCAQEAAATLMAEADNVHCLARPESFDSVDQFYLDFREVTDRDVAALLDATRHSPATEPEPDFADEHKSPTFADEPSTEAPDESVPNSHGGMDINRPRYLL